MDLMDYITWSNEYKQSADMLQRTIARLKEERESLPPAEREELDRRLRMHRACYRETIETSGILEQRAKVPS